MNTEQSVTLVSENRGIFASERGDIKEHIADYQFDVREEPVVTVSGIEVPNRRAIIRTDTNTVVGEVGSNYKVLTHYNALDPIIDRFKGKNVNIFQRIALVGNGARMYANIYFPDQEVNLSNPSNRRDAYWPGIEVTNSLDGILKYRLNATIYRLACTNGMRVPVHFASFETTHSKNKSFDELVDEILMKVSDGNKLGILQKWANHVLTTEAMGVLAETIVKDKRSLFPNRYLPLIKEEIAKESSNGVTTVWGLYNAFNSVLEHNLVRDKGKFERARMLDENLFKMFELTF